ncbi:hypothetical protein [Nocardiopsis synnemataformans]|uniref:hypothetical protein n=1 Tax=Nocardiopsis synnemataformans TaxID=61305 RepID=UPI003EB8B513
MASGEILGCASEYTATIHWRGGQRVYAYLDKIESVRWSRERRKISAASVSVAASGVGAGCMARLLETYEWVHELTLYRDGTAVWQGPVNLRDVTISGNQPVRVELSAVDVVGYPARRLLQRTRKLTDTDLSEVGRAVLESSLATRDPNVLDHIVTRPAGRSTSRTIQAYSRYGADELSEVAGLGVDWTTIGRTVYFDAPATASTTPQGAITGEHLLGDIHVVSSADDYASRVFAAPQAQNGVWQHVEAVGGYSPVYGLVDHLVQTSYPYNLTSSGEWEPSGEDALSRAQTNAALRRAAQSRHTQMSRPPLVVRPADSSRLDAATPISIHRLVPGARIDLAVGTQPPLAIQAAMRLTRVTVEWDATGEKVQVSLVQIGGPTDQDDLEAP